MKVGKVWEYLYRAVSEGETSPSRKEIESNFHRRLRQPLVVCCDERPLSRP